MLERGTYVVKHKPSGKTYLMNVESETRGELEVEIAYKYHYLPKSIWKVVEVWEGWLRCAVWHIASPEEHSLATATFQGDLGRLIHDFPEFRVS